MEGASGRQEPSLEAGIDVDVESFSRFEEGEPTLGEGEDPEPLADAASFPLAEGGPAVDDEASDPGELVGFPEEPPDEEATDDFPEDTQEAFRQRVSWRGLRFIARHEGFRSRLYNDPVGHCTIGYGHLVHLGPCNGTEPLELRRGISHERALQLLRRRANNLCAPVIRLGVPLNQHQFDALASFTFNLGGRWTTGSGLQRALKARNYAAVPHELSKWVYASGRKLPGLVTRRRAEGALFKDGRYWARS